MTEKQRKILSIAAFAVFILFFALLTVFLGNPLLSLFEDPEIFREWVEGKGFLARVFFVAMIFVQVIVALIPGEPLEIGAGIAFGVFEGTLLSLLGIFLGSLAVFVFVRKWGVKFVEVFFPVEKIQSLRFLQNSRRFEIVLFLIMMIPGTPKDLISYFVGLTKIKLPHWLFITTVARIPSVISSCMGGEAIGSENYLSAVIVFAVTLVLSCFGLFLYEHMIRPRREKKQSQKRNNNSTDAEKE